MKAIVAKQRRIQNILTAKHIAEKKAIARQTVQALKEHQKKATLADRLDDALAIREAIKKLEQGPGGTPDKAESEIPVIAGSFKGHRYLGVHINKIDWDQARQLCEKMGGHLATANTPQEFAFINALVGPNNLWSGGAYMRGKWRWIDGTAIDARLWHRIGPIKTAGANFVYFAGGAGTVANEASSHKNIPGFVCEWDR
jgi:hypothetical protein